jgi:prophage tail gpP-like protein
MYEREETVTIESSGGTGRPIRIDRATSYEVTTDLTAPSESRVEMGDNGTWAELKEAIAIGRRFRVALNGRGLLTGRLLMRGLPLSASAGATVQLTIRTRLADAAFTSCDNVNVKQATLKEIVLKAYATIGMTEADFEFNADVARNVMTGRSANHGAQVDLEAIKEQDARVQPPETVYAFVDRHLRRFGLLHWDGGDGKIVVGYPNDLQTALYMLRSTREYPMNNNVLEAARTEDYEQVPGTLSVYGQGGGRDYKRARVSTSVMDAVLSGVAPDLRRKTMVIDESITSPALAAARAYREMAMRSLNSDSWDVTVRGWTYRGIPYAVNTVADLVVDTASPTTAPMFIWRVSRSGNADNGHTARLTMAARGVWT